MNYKKIIVVLSLIALALFTVPERDSFACGGSATSICIVTTTSCLKSMVMAKSSPGSVLLPPGTSVIVNIPVSLFVIANNPAPGSCGVCTTPATPVSARIDMVMSPLFGGGTTATAKISTAGGTMTLPAASPLGSYNGYVVPITVPAGTLPGAYQVSGRATITFSDGITITQTGDTIVCLIDPAPGNPSVPRLDVQLLTAPAPRLAAGDQHMAIYRITNNDPVNAVTVTAFATSKQAAVRPQGANETQGVFAIANLFGDDFPVAFGPGPCIPFPAHPYTQPEIMLAVPPIQPNSFFDVFVNIRSYGGCASGSCSESTMRVSGTFADSSPAFACAAMALYVDTAQPTINCLPRTDDCNNNGIPDPVEIGNGSVPDTNYNAMIDSCEEGNAPIIPNPGQINPPMVPAGAPIQVSVNVFPDFGLPTTKTITNVWANGVPLNHISGPFWQGTIPADTRPGPQTVYFLAKQSLNGAIATHIGVYNTVAPSTCPLTVLPNNNSTSANARAPSTRFAFERSVYLITAAELAANGFAPGTSPTTIGWNYQTAPGVGGSAPLIVYMQNTSDTTNTKSTTWSTAIAGMTTVHNATTALPGAVGPFDITLAGGSPFTYTGGGLYIAFDWGQYTGTLSTTAVIWCNNTLLNGLLGNQSNVSAPTTLLASAFRPETRLSSSTQNDASTDAIYSYGELPLGLVPPQAIKAAISNRGAAPMNNLPVTLNVTGANMFSNMQTIPSLAGCTGQSIVTFAAFTPDALGDGTVMVSLPPDDISTNNNQIRAFCIAGLDYSYKYPGSTASGGVGLTGATGAFVGKFTITAANAVTDVKLEFFATSATTYKIAIYPDSGSGTPSTTPLYVDAADRTVGAAGPVTITLPSPVAVGPGNFYVGVQQTNTTNANYSFDNEVPIRGGSFYFASPNPPAAWTDFSPGLNFKLNVGVILQTAGGPTPSQVVSRKLHAGVPFEINLPLTGNPGIECRLGGPSNNYQIVYTFPSPVTFAGATVTSGVGTVSNTSGSGTTTAIVDLTNVANAQYITVTLMGATSGPNTPTADVGVRVGMLAGDVNFNSSVNAGDSLQVRAHSGELVDSTNFQFDVNDDGIINSGDSFAVRSRSGTALPPP